MRSAGQREDWRPFPRRSSAVTNPCAASISDSSRNDSGLPVPSIRAFKCARSADELGSSAGKYGGCRALCDPGYCLERITVHSKFVLRRP